MGKQKLIGERAYLDDYFDAFITAYEEKSKKEMFNDRTKQCMKDAFQQGVALGEVLAIRLLEGSPISKHLEEQSTNQPISGLRVVKPH